MRDRLTVLSASALAALLLVATSAEQAQAQRGGRDGGQPSMGGGRGPSAGSAGPTFEGRGPSPRSSSRDGGRAYSDAPRFDGRDGRRHGRRFHGDRFFYGAVPLYGTYGYGPCAYYYERAVATGSGYWWDRYYACTGDDYD
jgi:hypothetical protein